MFWLFVGVESHKSRVFPSTAAASEKIRQIFYRRCFDEWKKPHRTGEKAKRKRRDRCTRGRRRTKLDITKDASISKDSSRKIYSKVKRQRKKREQKGRALPPMKTYRNSERPSICMVLMFHGRSFTPVNLHGRKNES